MEIESITGQVGRLAMRHLNWDRSRGYPRAAHRMIFHHHKGFTGETELQNGDVFARALIADALCDARDAGIEELSGILESECNYLVDQRQRSACGGWSYFPGLPELPPDLDVLAQVIQVLVRCGRWSDLLAYVEPPLLTVFRDGVRPNGLFGTWIIPRQNRSLIEERQARFVTMAWGDTVDVEVNANFLFALALYGRKRFTRIIHRAFKAVLYLQDPDGSWQSNWYVGPYYGTYVCVRALAIIEDQECLTCARSFLINTQRPDGGWGTGLICSQLHTSLALCALCLISECFGITTGDRERMERAVHALEVAYALRGGWYASPFILMDVGRPRGEKGPELLYRSSSITAAYVLKAVIAVSRARMVSPRRNKGDSLFNRAHGRRRRKFERTFS